MATTQLNEMRKKMFRLFEEQLKARKPKTVASIATLLKTALCYLMPCSG